MKTCGWQEISTRISTPGYEEGNGDINPLYGTLYYHGRERCYESDDVTPDDATDIGSMSPLPPQCGNVSMTWTTLLLHLRHEHKQRHGWNVLNSGVSL